MLAIDHLIITTDDAPALAADLLARTGLAAVPGGRHAGHGTGNWLVPLGGAYLELLAVVDEGEARTSPFGSWVLDRSAHGLAAVCLRTDDADALAARIDRSPEPMSRVTTDGTVLRWRLTGLGDALSADGLPFFIEWDLGDAAHPGDLDVPHRAVPSGIVGLDLGGDAARVAAWLGAHDLPVRLVGGEPGPRTATIATDRGRVVITRDGIA